MNISCLKKKHILIFILCCFASPLFLVSQQKVDKQTYLTSYVLEINEAINNILSVQNTQLRVDLESGFKTNEPTSDSESHDRLLMIVISSILLNVICIIVLVYNFRKNRNLSLENKEQLKEISYLKLFKINQEDNVVSATTDKGASKFGVLDKLMKVDKFYLNPSCNRDTLIKELGIDKNSLSELLKKHKYDNLPDYINRFRLEESIRLLNDEEQFSIDQIAKQSGFGTSRSLQRQFKERYNISPSEYRKMISKNKNIVSSTDL